MNGKLCCFCCWAVVSFLRQTEMKRNPIFPYISPESSSIIYLDVNVFYSLLTSNINWRLAAPDGDTVREENQVVWLDSDGSIWGLRAAARATEALTPSVSECCPWLREQQGYKRLGTRDQRRDGGKVMGPARWGLEEDCELRSTFGNSSNHPDVRPLTVSVERRKKERWLSCESRPTPTET